MYSTLKNSDHWSDTESFCPSSVISLTIFTILSLSDFQGKVCSTLQKPLQLSQIALQHNFMKFKCSKLLLLFRSLRSYHHNWSVLCEIYKSCQPQQHCMLIKNKLLQYREWKATSLLPSTKQGWEYRPYAAHSLNITTGQGDPPKTAPSYGGSGHPDGSLDPPQVHSPNGILVGSAVSAQLTLVTTRQATTTTRPVWWPDR